MLRLATYNSCALRLWVDRVPIPRNPAIAFAAIRRGVHLQLRWNRGRSVFENRDCLNRFHNRAGHQAEPWGFSGNAMTQTTKLNTERNARQSASPAPTKQSAIEDVRPLKRGNETGVARCLSPTPDKSRR